MRLLRKDILLKLKVKNKGNASLGRAIDELISQIERSGWKTREEIKSERPDADQAHSDGFYFFDIRIHRTLILIELGDDGEATVVWAGAHADYERTFKNSKETVKKYLKDKGWI